MTLSSFNPEVTNPAETTGQSKKTAKELAAELSNTMLEQVRKRRLEEYHVVDYALNFFIRLHEI
jgi:hypothetical protein